MSWKRFGGLVAITVVILIIASSVVWFEGRDRFERPGPLPEQSIVFIPAGSGLAGIAQLLEDENVVEDQRLFQIGVRVLGQARSLKAGEYAFPAAVSMRGAAEILASGEVVVRRLTIVEGITSHEAVALIEAAEGLEGSLEDVPPEGSLLPETYHYRRGDSRQSVLERMKASRDKVLSELWESRAEGLPIKTPEEAVILASIVEKETGVADERALVAGVFVNRLNKGMRLQSDPTVTYGITLGVRPLGRELSRRDLRQPSAYNTYVINGLPPAPIANAGRAALAAVLNPEATGYLYFVADGTGGHAFAKTLKQHNRNVAKWRRFKRSGGQ
ncbi:endolytic transglycosylase MltG [Denitrobaculum tricleocarpae]|uniref:Endolytic murein transglycosylase n=1 Tax=Denitrobaculum tricleocarpae TaxID=2591009 RepID=A0A545TTY4_9PROT|nr:endolytic transglycosylase MltG [Denitrobaculum tricleocarpae]TQV80678.1 endolytic transglycosylase MltG [Denitrobaculum tricleocarpae]